MDKHFWPFLDFKIGKNVSFPLEYLLRLIRPKGQIRQNQLQTFLIFLKTKKNEIFSDTPIIDSNWKIQLKEFWKNVKKRLGYQFNMDTLHT